MRENRPYGLEGGESGTTGLPYPYPHSAAPQPIAIRPAASIGIGIREGCRWDSKSPSRSSQSCLIGKHRIQRTAIEILMLNDAEALCF